jgi:phosphoribosylamine--glycine ligase
MIHHEEPSVVEFNARFGDPETQSVLAVLRSDFARLLHSAARGAVDVTAVNDTESGVSCTVILASKGYPDSYEKGFVIAGMSEASKVATVFHAGTTQADSEVRTAGGRVLGVTAHGSTLREARDTAYTAAAMISFDNKTLRTDIAQKGLKYEESMTTMKPSGEHA